MASVAASAPEQRGFSRKALARCDGVLTLLGPWGVDGYSTGPAQAVLDYPEPAAGLVFSCGWHITNDGKFKAFEKIFGGFTRLFRAVDLKDQVDACRRIFESDRRWTVVRGSYLKEGKSERLPFWSRHVGAPILRSNLTRRVDFALFMVHALENDRLVQETPAIVGRNTPATREHAAAS